jgi:branched-chain amino acid transport system permease protein
MKGNIHLLRGGSIPFVVVALLLAVLPLIGVPQAWLLYLFLFFIYLAMANMWNLLAGYCGLISLCQHAFVGLAGYVLAVGAWVGLPLYLGIIGGGIVATAFALVISVPVFRMRGIYFAVGTLIVPEALRIVLFLWRPVGGMLQGKGAGYMVKGATGIAMMEVYWFAFVVGVGSVFLMRGILGSKIGLGLAAIRDNDGTAASSGINVFRLKLTSFLISASVTGLAGAIFFMFQGYIEPTIAFDIKWTMICMLSTVIGGISIREGPVLGAAIVVFLHFLLARYGGISLLIQGFILVLIMLVAPQGIMGALGKTRPFRSLLQIRTSP